MTKKTIKEEIVDSILNDIINNVYPVDHVFTEKSLIEKYCVSKSPVRDALMELCGNEVLKSIPRYGYVIIPISEKKVREIAELRLIVEPSMFKISCEKCLDKVLEFVRNHNQQEAAQKDLPRRPIAEEWRVNIDFHVGLLSFSGNQYICDVIEKSLENICRSYTQLYNNHRRALNVYSSDEILGGPNHNKIEYFLEQGDIEGAVNALKEDIKDMWPKGYVD